MKVNQGIKKLDYPKTISQRQQEKRNDEMRQALRGSYPMVADDMEKEMPRTNTLGIMVDGIYVLSSELRQSNQALERLTQEQSQSFRRTMALRHHLNHVAAILDVVLTPEGQKVLREAQGIEPSKKAAENEKYMAIANKKTLHDLRQYLAEKRI